MATFTEKMRTLTGELAECAHARSETLDALRSQTERLLSNADKLMRRLGREHDAMAKQVRTSLSEDREERVRQVAEAREQINKRFHELQERLHETLQTCREARHEHVGHLLQGFDEARQALADDLQEAGRIWRGHHDGKAARHKRGAKGQHEKTHEH